jgi:hypothetical protein
VKVPHSFHFDAAQVKSHLGVIDKAWETFVTKVSRMALRPMTMPEVSCFFDKILTQKDGVLPAKAERERETLMALYNSAPGQELNTAKGTLWGAINAVTYYADHVRRSSTGDRLDSAWFGAGCLLKDKAWATAGDIISPRE